MPTYNIHAPPALMWTYCFNYENSLKGWSCSFRVVSSMWKAIGQNGELHRVGRRSCHVVPN
ncbi:hypothetical protein HBI44_020900 [Parastagonospora nodorum]|nr:hypothetical protein HBI44_020900 [Parastagonospora nodorum]